MKNKQALIDAGWVFQQHPVFHCDISFRDGMCIIWDISDTPQGMSDVELEPFLENFFKDKKFVKKDKII